MKLVIAIVQSADSGRLTDALVAHDFRSTRLNTVGGFLDEPNVTMLIVTEDDRLSNLMSLIRQNCQSRRRYMNAAPLSVEAIGTPVMAAAPIEVEVGGATVFALPVRCLVRLGTSTPPPVTGMSGPQTMLVVAVVQAEEVPAVTGQLIKAGYHLTRINTIGSFLKKGNVTLLIGVKADYVDPMLSLIHAACRQRADPSPVKAGIPMYAVTAFVLDTVPVPTQALGSSPRKP